MKKAVVILINVLLHIVAVGVIIYCFLPIAKWYLDYRPIWGVDFYNTVTLLAHLKENFTLLHSGWLYFWFGGFPLLSGYPLLHIYLILPLAHFFDLVYSVQLWAMISVGLFAIGSYFLFYVLSRNFVLSVILAVMGVYSGGVYQTLTWAGSIPSFATQAFYPWVLGFIALYQQRKSLKNVSAAGLIAGLAITGHPQVFAVYIFPSAIFLIFLNFSEGLKIIDKIKKAAVFLSITVLIGLPFTYTSIGNVIKQAFQPSYSQNALSTTKVNAPTQTELDIAQFNKNQVERMISDNDQSIFIFLIISSVFFIVSLILGRKFKSVLNILPWLVLASIYAFYIWLFGQGVSIFHGGWYRLFWSVPIWIGALSAALFGEGKRLIERFLKTNLLKITFESIFSLIILSVSLIFLNNKYSSTIDKIIYRSQPSSAYPDVMNLEIGAKELNSLKSQIAPGWLKGDDTNFRLYEADQTVNIWWNALFKMPLSRGYLDPPAERGFLFWLDAALSETDGEPQLVKSFGYPLGTAISNAQFLIDWNAIKFYEGGHVGDAYTPFPKYLSNLVGREEISDFNAKKYTKRQVTLRFNEIKDGITSPILTATNAKTIGIFASENGYETVVRSIAELGNLNSQVLIPIKLGKLVDEYNNNELVGFDALYLYDYDYKNRDKAFASLYRYIEEGKKIFIDTGIEVKESSGLLPELFPVEEVERKGMSKTWNLENPNKDLTGNVNFSKFSPPIFDEAEWKMSYSSPDSLKSSSKVILKNQGNIIMASQKIGDGEVIWSGINFAYFLTRFHDEEAGKFSFNILNELIDLSKKPTLSFNAKFLNAGEREIEVNQAKGILFKEGAYDGWQAGIIKGSGKKSGKLRIFKAGPSSPGFMYVFLPDNGSYKIRFKFGGSLGKKIVSGISGLTIVLIAEEILFNGLIIGRLRKKLVRKAKSDVTKWWETEDE